MKLPVFALVLTLACVPPAVAEGDKGEMSEGIDLLGRGAQLLFRGLMSEMEPALQEMGRKLSDLEPMLRDLAGKIGSVADYEMPEVLPNGDIIIRRKQPLPAAPDPKAEIEI